MNEDTFDKLFVDVPKTDEIDKIEKEKEDAGEAFRDADRTFNKLQIKIRESIKSPFENEIVEIQNKINELKEKTKMELKEKKALLAGVRKKKRAATAEAYQKNEELQNLKKQKQELWKKYTDLCEQLNDEYRKRANTAAKR